MNTQTAFISTFLFFALCCASTAKAAHAIYTTTAQQTIYGYGKITKVAVKGFLVFNPDTLNGTAIGSFTLSGAKYFTIVPLQNYGAYLVAGPAGSVYTVLAKAERPGTQFAGTLLESVHMRGLNTSVVIDGAGARSIPKTFTSSSRSVARNEQSGAIATSESTGAGKLDVKGSFASNLSETDEAAVARLRTYFISRGYTEFTAPAAN